MLKKVQEISVLCGVDACGIIYSPEEAVSQVWPQTHDAGRILTEFNNLPELERTRKMTNHLAFLQARCATLREKVVKKENDNTKLEARALICEGFGGSDFAELSPNELQVTANTLDNLISNVFGRMMTLSKQAQNGGVVGAGMERGVTKPF
ncbi:AGAMOUS-like MADS-box protein [Rhynchospora pubera]|uniref:AGAMOUS-like MADS-box protein n=1 Tax=Rhynchospora pubera TaxID=906938 RepID=A0AAV8G4M1_9POAL|nr:AGAMOUS-like MADS-box protein [Rhynchospora pubera]